MVYKMMITQYNNIWIKRHQNTRKLSKLNNDKSNFTYKKICDHLTKFPDPKKTFSDIP